MVPVKDFSCNTASRMNLKADRAIFWSIHDKHMCHFVISKKSSEDTIRTSKSRQERKAIGAAAGLIVVRIQKFASL